MSVPRSWFKVLSFSTASISGEVGFQAPRKCSCSCFNSRIFICASLSQFPLRRKFTVPIHRYRTQSYRRPRLIRKSRLHRQTWQRDQDLKSRKVKASPPRCSWGWARRLNYWVGIERGPTLAVESESVRLAEFRNSSDKFF